MEIPHQSVKIGIQVFEGLEVTTSESELYKRFLNEVFSSYSIALSYAQCSIKQNDLLLNKDFLVIGRNLPANRFRQVEHHLILRCISGV
jgi:hypothetical protein